MNKKTFDILLDVSDNDYLINFEKNENKLEISLFNSSFLFNYTIEIDENVIAGTYRFRDFKKIIADSKVKDAISMNENTITVNEKKYTLNNINVKPDFQFDVEKESVLTLNQIDLSFWKVIAGERLELEKYPELSQIHLKQNENCFTIESTNGYTIFRNKQNVVILKPGDYYIDSNDIKTLSTVFSPCDFKVLQVKTQNSNGLIFQSDDKIIFLKTILKEDIFYKKILSNQSILFTNNLIISEEEQDQLKKMLKQHRQERKKELTTDAEMLTISNERPILVNDELDINLNLNYKVKINVYDLLNSLKAWENNELIVYKTDTISVFKCGQNSLLVKNEDV